MMRIWKESGFVLVQPLFLSFLMCCRCPGENEDVSWDERMGGGGGYCCKPATKLGFELWSGRFRLLVVGQFDYLESVKQSLRPRLDFNRLTHRHHSAVTSPCVIFLSSNTHSLWKSRSLRRPGEPGERHDEWHVGQQSCEKTQCHSFPGRWLRWGWWKGENFMKVHVEKTPINTLSAVWSSHRIFLLNSKITMAANLFPPPTGDSPSTGHSSPRWAENNEESSREPPQRPERCQKPGLQQKRGQ